MMRLQIGLWFKIYAVALLISAFVFGCDSGPKVHWQTFDESALTTALKSGKPTLAYFYAAWCGPCRQLRSTTFRDPDVIQALSDWNRLKADMSFREDKTTIARTQTFEVWALPTLIFYDAQGKEAAKSRGFMSASKMLEILNRLNSAR